MFCMEWIKENLLIFYDELDGYTIDWGNNIYTPVDFFYERFKNVIATAIKENKDVKKEIAKVDEGYGRLLLN